MQWTLPRFSHRFAPVWLRNLRVWRKLFLPSLMGNFGEPLLYLLAFGYGLGRMLQAPAEGMAYSVFLASGIVASSAMNAASFEALWSVYTRMQVQQTWAAMLSAPLEVDDVVLGEVVWAATKAMINASAILVVASALGLVTDWRAVAVLPVVVLAGLCFAALAITVTALARSYDFFMYYFTLVLTPMFLLSGVFFPITELPAPVQAGAWALPLAHVVALVRPLMVGAWPSEVAVHLAVVIAYGLGGLFLAVNIFRRRLLR